MSRGGVIRLLDNIKDLPFDHAMFLAVSQLRSIQVSPYTCNSKSVAVESKTFHVKVKGSVWRRKTQCTHGEFLGGSDRWCHHTSMLIET